MSNLLYVPKFPNSIIPRTTNKTNIPREEIDKVIVFKCPFTLNNAIKNEPSNSSNHEGTNAIPFQNSMDFHERFITTLELAIRLNLQIKQVIKKYTI
jgi:hypothetical protein